ncbi:ABC transporter ATP-binding protein [Actinomadura montaniterrae]|uniref:ABC transporter ATP-binding protein n=1 Tax=Actinomadura montaniterrae TaxID=1803903 RepID=A0A6L3VXG3_9ACTN|nr:ABC transporter ATP-binding protein [Actinomadura montaniterrae]KAB2384837.1 ABC transporter ATP-binding protein [Actinomadura montaniterrae]
MSGLLTVDGLRVTYPGGERPLHAVDGVSLHIEAGTTLGLVGESGSGKSTLGRGILGLAPVTAGTVRLNGKDITHATAKARRDLCSQIQMVFQDPYASLNPRMPVGKAIVEPMAEHLSLSNRELRLESGRLLELVGLSASDANRYPFQFSGGQRQRIAIARALALKPSLIIADEITSALDVSVQAAILNLLRELQRETGVAFLFISHNLAVVRYLSDRIAVMNLGKIVEEADAGRLFSEPRHPYTSVLIGAVPRVHQREDALRPLQGDVPDPLHPPAGCRFHTRCPVGPAVRSDRGSCAVDQPLGESGPDGTVACHFPLTSSGRS